MNTFLFVCMFHLCNCDWVSEWLAPIRDQYRDTSARRIDKLDLKVIDSEKLKMIPIAPEPSESTMDVPKDNVLFRSTSNVTLTPSSSLKIKLETTLQNAKQLEANLKSHIIEIQQREQALKEAIVMGRLGVTTLIVSMLKGPHRKYIIRDGFWTICNGMIQHPTTPPDVMATVFSELYSAPRCIGQEIVSKPDPCVFNSIIKYDTIPTQRKPEYLEDEYLCLKPTFNNTLEHYFSVTKQTVNQTCKNGIVRSYLDNISECGIRVMSEYTYYPHRSLGATYLPLEYCEGSLGSCKLIVAWHVSNSSVENFEFIKDDQNFKDYFIKSGPYVNNAVY